MHPRISRREYLTAVGASGFSLLSGCGKEETTTNTAVFQKTDQSTSKSTSTFEEDGNTTSVKTNNIKVFSGGKTSDFIAALDFLRNRGGGKLVVEEDRYELESIDPTDEGSGSNPHARIQDLEDITIEGNGAKFVFQNPTQAGFRFRRGANITIRNLKFDYDPVPFTQGTIEDLESGGRVILLTVDEGFPKPTHPMFQSVDSVYTLIFRKDGEFIRGIKKRGNLDHHISKVSRVGDRKFKLFLTDDSSTEGLEIGRKLTVLARNNESVLAFYKVTNPVIQNVSIHSANGGGFSSQVCSNPEYKSCNIRPPRNSDRLISANADGVRIINCISSALVEDCNHEYLGDDSVVIQHTLTKVNNVIDDYSVSVANVHPFVLGKDDKLDVLTPTGKRGKTLPPISDFEPYFQTPGPRDKPKSITFQEEISGKVSEGDFIRNLATGSQNFRIRNNTFRNHRANLIRIAASNGVIEDNILEGCSIDPIELETDTFGYFAPKGWVDNVVVMNNEISRAGLNYVTDEDEKPAGIHVHHRPEPGVETNGRPNQNISIKKNDISSSAALGIDVEAAENVEILDNSMSHLNQMIFPGFGDIALRIREVENVEVSNNSVTGKSDSLDYFGLKSATENLTSSGNTKQVDERTSPGKLVSLDALTLEYSKAVRPTDVNPDSTDDRLLAFWCSNITLIDSGGDPFLVINIGDGEDGVLFGKGVFPLPPGADGRWFGGEEKESELYFADADLKKAEKIHLKGYPMTDGISAELILQGSQTNKIQFGQRGLQTYTASL